MSGQVNIGGAWKNVSGVYVNIGGSWKTAQSMKCNIGGSWKDGWNGGFDVYTKSMLHFNGTNGSTVFTDEIGKVWTPHGSAQISTAQYKFGGASALFNSATNDYISTPDSADWDFGSNNFTVDCWFYKTSSDAYLWNHGTTSQIFLRYNNAAGTLRWAAYNGVSYDFDINVTTTINSNTWYHIACVRNGNTFTLYKDGVSIGTTTFSGALTDISSPFEIGRVVSTYYTGYIDEFRISNGIARWTSNFTPPTSEYT